MSDALKRARDYIDAVNPRGPDVRTELNELRRAVDMLVEHIEQREKELQQFFRLEQTK